MAEHYEDIIYNGKVVGHALVSDAPPSPVTAIERAGLLARMTPTELHGWRRAAQRALETNTPVAADRNAMYAWLRWESMQGTVDLTSDDIRALGGVWVALGMTTERAEEILTPLIQ